MRLQNNTVCDPIQMTDQKKIQALLDASKQVILDCAFPGGGIVAANSFNSYAPAEAKNYKFVWPRDGAFICYAANILDLDIQDRFFSWCMKAEGWEQKGIFYEKYFLSGKQVAGDFQPDQTGTLLWSLYEYIKDDSTKQLKYKRLVCKTADGLLYFWKKDKFNIVSQDLWEERYCFPDMNENFTYSLAACYRGLLCAHELFPNETWKEAAQEMKETILANSPTHFYRSFGKLPDHRLDASLIALAWPFELVDLTDSRFIETIQKMESEIVKEYKVFRYEHDEYDGWMYNLKVHRRKGAGYWPLLNLWFAIYHAKNGNLEKAMEYFNQVINDIENDLLPEQIFDNDLQISVCPRSWTHAMFVIACKELGLI